MMASLNQGYLYASPKLPKIPFLRADEHLQYQQEMAAVRNLYYEFILILNYNSK